MRNLIQSTNIPHINNRAFVSLDEAAEFIGCHKPVLKQLYEHGYYGGKRAKNNGVKIAVKSIEKLIDDLSDPDFPANIKDIRLRKLMLDEFGTKWLRDSLS